jgi:hypothetical protein
MAKGSKPDKPQASTDKLIKPTRKGDVELTEEELKGVSGGPTAVEYKNFLKIDGGF